MNARSVLEALGEIGDVYLEEALRQETVPRRPHRRRTTVLLIAAALILLLVGCSVAAALYGDSIQSWFAYQWERATGQSMSREQMAVIDHLSQEIGQSQRAGDLTVTVDSATVGDDCFFLLLRVEGERLSARYSYNFSDLSLAVSPDPLEDAGGLGSYGFDYLGEDGDGAGLLLLTYAATSGAGYVADTGELEVRLTLRDFVRGSGGREKVVAAGEWAYAFTLDRGSLPETRSLPDTVAAVEDLYGDGRIPLLLEDLVLTNTGLRFSYDFQNGTVAFSDQICARLNSGQTVHANSGSGTPLNGGPLLACSYQWEVPIDLDQVAWLEIGSTKILLPDG